MTGTWFVTGASSGFGRCITELLLDRGDRVAATSRHPESLADLQRDHEQRFWPVEMDLNDTGSIRRAVDSSFRELGKLDVIVSNAGAGLVGAAEEVTDEQLRHQIETNLIGAIQLARAVISRLRQQGGGRIIQVTSMVPIAIPGLSIYHAAKWGVEGFWEAVIPEIAPFGIGVTMVQPGSARTSFGRGVTIAPAIPEYQRTPVALRRAKAPGDPVKMARAIITCAELPRPPRRLTLGSDAYRQIGAALREQLAELEAGKTVACATDADDVLARTGQ
jgi:NAD(P)-dependent dehydrogenase (short-subunit alcohol dehydrogenase family)